MSHKAFPPKSGLSSQGALRLPEPSPKRRVLSRRGFLRTAAGAGLILGSGLWLPRRAHAAPGADAMPTPIPFSRKLAGYGPFHFNFPGPVDSPDPFLGKPGPYQPSVINDFNGFIGVEEFSGSGADADGNPHTFSGEIRFMKGVYVGADGKNHRGTFALV